MLVPFLNADGAVGSPGISWVNETTSGLYRAGLNDQRFSSSGVDKVQITADPSNPLLVWIVGDASFRAVLNIFNPYTIIGDWTWEGRVVTDDSTTARAGFNIPVGVEPTVPVQGDMWVEAGNIFAWLNGVAESLIGSNAVGASAAASRMLRGDGSGGWVDAGASALLSAGGNLDLTLLRINSGADIIQLSVAGSSAFLGSIGGTISYFRTDEPWRMENIFLSEQGSADIDVGGHGQLWCDGPHVVGTNPNVMMFTDDSGTDYRLDGMQRQATLLDVVKNGDDVLSNIGNLSGYIIAPARRYKCKATIFWSSTTVADIKFALNYSQTAEELGFAMWTCTSAVSTVETDVELSAFAEINITTMETGTNCVLIEFTFESHATLAGTLALQFAQNTSSGVNTTILQPSFFEVSENDNIS
jgi:hypothetical protein